MGEELACTTLLEKAKDEWGAFKEYNNMPEPFKSFAMDELKHFSHIALQIRKECPKQAKEIDALVKER